jgi:hypothetical protein
VYDRHCGGMKRDDARLVIVIGMFFVLLLPL